MRTWVVEGLRSSMRTWVVEGLRSSLTPIDAEAGSPRDRARKRPALLPTAAPRPREEYRTPALLSISPAQPRGNRGRLHMGHFSTSRRRATGREGRSRCWREPLGTASQGRSDTTILGRGQSTRGRRPGSVKALWCPLRMVSAVACGPAATAGVAGVIKGEPLAVIGLLLRRAHSFLARPLYAYYMRVSRSTPLRSSSSGRCGRSAPRSQTPRDSWLVVRPGDWRPSRCTCAEVARSGSGPSTARDSYGASGFSSPACIRLPTD